jgi:hypothetical protein
MGARPGEVETRPPSRCFLQQKEFLPTIAPRTARTLAVQRLPSGEHRRYAPSETSSRSASVALEPSWSAVESPVG